MNLKGMLDYVYEHEAAQPDKVFLIQPLGGGALASFTWAQVLDQSRRMAAHLTARGLGRGDQVAILSRNCAHFFMAELAIWMAGATTVAIYPTERVDTIRFVLEHSEAKLLFVGKLDRWEQQSAGVPAGLPIITMPLAPATRYPRWDDVADGCVPLSGTPGRVLQDLALIAYTSGSTGQPKGVMHSFEGVTRATESIVAVLEGLRHADQLGAARRPERMLSYLPLAHVVERAWVECVALVRGDTQVFFTESQQTFPADVQRARPTFFHSVPRLWMLFQQGVFTKIAPARLAFLLEIPILGRLVAHRILVKLGLDHTHTAGSGAAPLPPQLIAWYAKLGLDLSEAYGMTEDFACSHCSSSRMKRPGYVGAPCPGVEVRLGVDHEVEVKSPGKMVGYFKRPDLDAASFMADGFFRTGDTGELSPEGLLKITGRSKELFKTGKGKYVAPAPIETLLNAHPMVESSMVSGVGQQAAFGMVVLSEALRSHVHEAAVSQEVEQALVDLLKGVNAQLSAHERLRMLVISTQPWTIENGCLTQTLKIRRGHIEAAVADQVSRWYADSRPVVWS